LTWRKPSSEAIDIAANRPCRSSGRTAGNRDLAADHGARVELGLRAHLDQRHMTAPDGARLVERDVEFARQFDPDGLDLAVDAVGATH
jgi:hypothetical protein